MNRKIFAFITAVMGAIGVLSANAGEHADAALQHARDAADSIGDSRSIREHATEALKHVEAAKAANASNPEVLEHLGQGEAELNHAVSHARRFNSPTAAAIAEDATGHLESAHQAVGR